LRTFTRTTLDNAYRTIAMFGLMAYPFLGMYKSMASSMLSECQKQILLARQVYGSYMAQQGGYSAKTGELGLGDDVVTYTINTFEALHDPKTAEKRRKQEEKWRKTEEKKGEKKNKKDTQRMEKETQKLEKETRKLEKESKQSKKDSEKGGQEKS